MNNRPALPPHLEYCDELATYIEQAGCAVAVLGDLLEVVPEENLGEGRTQSLGFLLKILGDGIMQRSMDGYNFIQRNREAAPLDGSSTPSSLAPRTLTKTKL